MAHTAEQMKTAAETSSTASDDASSDGVKKSDGGLPEATASRQPLKADKTIVDSPPTKDKKKKENKETFDLSIVQVVKELMGDKSVLKRLDRLEAKLAKKATVSQDVTLTGLVKNLLQHLVPMDPVDRALKRVGRNYDGGYIMAVNDTSAKVAYSLGINKDVSWDLAMASDGFSVFQYDHTIEKLPLQHPKFTFFRKGIASRHGVTDAFTSIEAELANNRHLQERNAVLKIDVEGAEWEIFAAMEQDTLARFSQILVEFHGFDHVRNLPWYRQAESALTNLARTHHVIHVHGNNNSEMMVLGGIPMSKTLEVSYLRKDVCDFKLSARVFPTELDQPNNPTYAQHYLGSFRYL